MYDFLKRPCVAVLALALVLAVAAPVLADDARGNIAWIDPDNHTFTLVDESNNVLEMRFLIGGKVLLNDEEATIWDLLPGDRVQVSFNFMDNERAATAIECRRLE
jgi:hypothetical protein